MVFFGANDACLPGSDSGQYVPLESYMQNLKRIISHQTVVAQHPHLILVTPPPVDEYQIEVFDAEKGYSNRSRTAEHTKKYADACRQIGQELNVVVLDLWTLIMAKAGHRPGEPLPGSKEAPRNDTLTRLLSDGKTSKTRSKL